MAEKIRAYKQQMPRSHNLAQKSTFLGRIKRSYLGVSPFSETIGHDNPECSIQVVGNGFHNLQCMCF